MRGRSVQGKVELHILIHGFDAAVYNGSLIKVEVQLFAGILKHIQILQQSFRKVHRYLKMIPVLDLLVKKFNQHVTAYYIN